MRAEGVDAARGPASFIVLNPTGRHAMRGGRFFFVQFL